MESLKTKSRITTFIVAVIFGIITYIAAMNPDNLAVYLGVYGSYAPVIIIIAGIIVNQYSEESRVKRAEELVHHEYTVLGYPKEKSNDNVNTTTDNITLPIQEISKNTENNDDDSICIEELNEQ